MIAYNKQACGYHFDTNFPVKEYLNDFKNSFKHYSNYPLLNNKKLNFKNEILFFTNEYDAKDYKFVLNYESGKINISYDESFYSKELIETFLESIEVLLDRFESSGSLLKDISIRRELEYDEDFKIELANEGVVNKVFDRAVAQNNTHCRRW